MNKNKQLKLLAAIAMMGSIYLSSACSDVSAAQSIGTITGKGQYVAVAYDKDLDAEGRYLYVPNTNKQKVYFEDGLGRPQIYNKVYQNGKAFWVRDGYVLSIDNNGGKYTDLSSNAMRADVSWEGVGKRPVSVLESAQSIHAATGVNTNLGESLNTVDAGVFSGVSNVGGTDVNGSWNYIVHDSSWKTVVAPENYKNGYADLVSGGKFPRNFKTVGNGLIWDASHNAYRYNDQIVSNDNLYVINGQVGVFTNADSTKVYTGTVYGRNNEVLMTTFKDGKLYSFWAAKITDPAITMEMYPLDKYNEDLHLLADNDIALHNNDIKEMQLTKNNDTATLKLLRNGVNGAAEAVDGSIVISGGGGRDGKDTFVQFAADNDAANAISFNTGSKVAAISNNENKVTGLVINGENYTLQDNDTNIYVKSGEIVEKDGKKYLSLTRSDNSKVDDIDMDGFAADPRYQDLDGAAVKYDKSYDQSVNYSSMTLNGDRYNNKTGGTHIYNVAYASGNDGSEAVNVDYLKDRLAEAAAKASEKERKLIPNPQTKDGSYKVDANGEVHLQVRNEDGDGYAVTISDVASKEVQDEHTKAIEEIKREADKHTTVSGSENITVTPTTNDGQTDYKVSLNDYVKLGDKNTGAFVGLNGQQSTIELGEKAAISAQDNAGENKIAIGGEQKVFVNTAKDSATVDGLTNTQYTRSDAEKASFNRSQAASQGQLKDVDDKVEANRTAIGDNSERINNLEGRMNNIDSRINEVGAMAVAMAGLKPLDYDPEAPTEISAAVGNYKGQTAMAVGVFHHPNEDVLLNVGVALSSSEVAVNAGATFRLGRKHRAVSHR